MAEATRDSWCTQELRWQRSPGTPSAPRYTAFQRKRHNKTLQNHIFAKKKKIPGDEVAEATRDTWCTQEFVPRVTTGKTQKNHINKKIKPKITETR